MRTVQQTRLVATIVIQRHGDGYRASDDSGELDGLEDESGASYWPVEDPDLDYVIERALEVASELRQTPVDRREGRGDNYLVQIEDHTSGTVEVLEGPEDY